MHNISYLVILLLLLYIALNHIRQKRRNLQTLKVPTKWDLLSQKYGKKTGRGDFCSHCNELYQGIAHDCRCSNYGFTGDDLQKELAELEQTTRN